MVSNKVPMKNRQSIHYCVCAKCEQQVDSRRIAYVGEHAFCDTCVDEANKKLEQAEQEKKEKQMQMVVSGKSTFTAVKVFSATMFEHRLALGDVITAWLAKHPKIEIVDRIVTQSSDAAFHCLCITFFYKEVV